MTLATRSMEPIGTGKTGDGFPAASIARVAGKTISSRLRQATELRRGEYSPFPPSVGSAN